MSVMGRKSVTVSTITASNLDEIGKHLTEGEETERPRTVAIRYLAETYFDQFEDDFEIKEPLEEDRPAQYIYTEGSR